jgi:cardiolipin synthase A/B
VAEVDPVPNASIRERAERVLSVPPSAKAFVLGFEESTASSVEVLVEGASFYPRMLADIAAASSSVHVNQFGFRPGLVGDRFADALIAKAGEGVSVRLIVDRQGSDPERSSKDFYDRLTAAGIEVCVVRATRLRVPTGALGGGGATRWNVRGLGHIDHRKFIVVDGRVGWVGGAGIEDHFQDGRFHDLFVRVQGPVVAQFQLVFLASFRWLEGEVDPAELDVLVPAPGAPIRSPPASCTTRRAPTGQSRTQSRASWTTRPRRSTSSTHTSPTAG